MAGDPSIDNLHPIFRQQLLAFIAASGGKVRIGSGWRSYEQQARLYADYKAGKPGQARAAPPGKSNHNFGLAADLIYGPGGREWAHANAWRFGLRFPMGDEPWHVEPIAVGQMRSGAPVMAELIPAPQLTPEQAKARAKELYGYLGWFVDHPEIGPILVKAAQEGWDQMRLQGELAKTSWWQNTAESARQWEALLVSDPATARRRIQETALSIKTQAAQLGVPIGDNRIFAMAVEALRMGWNEEELRLALAAELKWRPGVIPTAGMAKLVNDVGQIANEYLIPINDKQRFEWARRIAAGAADIEAVRQHMKNLALARFPHLAEQLDAGLTPAEFFTPYRNVIAQLLEISPDDIDLMSERWAPIVSYADPVTGHTRPMTFTEAERYARSLPEWSRTTTAWEEGTQLAETITQLFGRVA